ncbi:MAG: prepilin-type N-terminal cleavage/methylation domain-containing protein [Minisyncoccia bacterium]
MFKQKKAFTLIEIIIVVAIVTYIMSMVLFNYISFNDKLSLAAAGKELLIAVRQAQSYGINVREVTKDTGDFSRAYGIYFYPASSPSSYYIFVDKNGDELYNDSLGSCISSGECVEKVDLRNNVTMASFSLVGSNCPASNSARDLYITFRRPNPDTVVYYTNPGGKIKSCPTTTNVTQIVLTSSRGTVLTISIDPTGQVSMQ